jgi:hypothetical protein
LRPAPAPNATPRRILEDASGNRRRWLRRVGRVVALCLGVWLLVVFLGGIGVGPAKHVPFGHLLRPSTGPPPLRQPLKVTPPAAADLIPALPAPKSQALPALTATTPVKVKGKSAAAPGQSTTTTTSPGKSAVAPGQTTTIVHGNKPVAPPGQTKTTTTKAHGKP